jgi:hypothetical protein
MTDEQQKLVSAFNAAAKRLNGSSGKSASGIESAYGEAYQALVKAGLAPQLKAKYRR